MLHVEPTLTVSQRLPKKDGDMKVRLTQEHLIRMRIPEVHWACRLSEIPEGCSHRKRLSEYIENIEENISKPKGLLLFGEYSQGKSGCASILLKAAAAHGIIGFWIVARRLPEYQIEKEMFDETMTIWQRAETVPFLVIDEMILRTDIKFTEQAFEGLVRKRVDDKLCTIITTNHTPTFIQEKYPALSAVMLEAVYPVKVAGHDFRKDKADTLKGN